ncbi:TetR/AcrR family transcriptional regulator, partial [Mesorhizobium sp. M8A.F.Ca.ET.142.01.1.1]
AILGAAETLSEGVMAGALDKANAEAELQRLIVATVKRR